MKSPSQTSLGVRLFLSVVAIWILATVAAAVLGADVQMRPLPETDSAWRWEVEYGEPREADELHFLFKREDETRIAPYVAFVDSLHWILDLPKTRVQKGEALRLIVHDLRCQP